MVYWCHNEIYLVLTFCNLNKTFCTLNVILLLLTKWCKHINNLILDCTRCYFYEIWWGHRTSELLSHSFGLIFLVIILRLKMDIFALFFLSCISVLIGVILTLTVQYYILYIYLKKAPIAKPTVQKNPLNYSLPEVSFLGMNVTIIILYSIYFFNRQ